MNLAKIIDRSLFLNKTGKLSNRFSVIRNKSKTGCGECNETIKPPVKKVDPPKSKCAKTECDDPKSEQKSCKVDTGIPTKDTKIIKPICNKATEGLSVALIGGGRTMGFTCLLLKQNPSIRELKVVDTDNSLAPMICDIRNIDTSTRIRRFDCSSMNAALYNCDIVGIMDETDFHPGNDGPIGQLSRTADYVRMVAERIAGNCPKALIAVLSRPVTGSVPLISEAIRLTGMDWNPGRILGSATLESMRAANLAANYLGLESYCVSVPLAGGPDPLCLVPLLSRARPFGEFTAEEYFRILEELRMTDRKLGETEAKGPTISTAVASAKFISSIVNGIRGESISICCGFVRSDIVPGCKYMTSQVKFGPEGVEKNYGLPKLNSLEIQIVQQTLPMINRVVECAESFARCGQYVE